MPRRLLPLFAVMLAACASDRVAVPDTGARTESRTLVYTLHTSLRDAMADKSVDAVNAAANAMREQFREALATTDIEEAAMRAGRFDDRGNLDRLAYLLEQAEGQQVQMLSLLRVMLEDLETGKLRGARLELTTRLLAIQLKATAVQNLQKAF